ncbi:hypothetical protein BKA56DRAFT_197550 [Ilyonectria sp. MPI-CAGE-AT-0026]|nr:hypothetical protein BKA56DRAFT_197550 [Ilyonectria sp. MPI-CAGE-AT-0026]
MAASAERHLGLHLVTPIDDAHTTLDIVAIHGLDTESPRTWEYKKKPEHGGGVVNWLADADMLPAAIPEARIFTYDWNANCFQDAPVKAILGHSDTLLTHLAETRDTGARPIIFIASCFGGLVLAEAVNRAAREGSPYREILVSIAGIVFLATPFRGSDAAQQAQWSVLVHGIMGRQSSRQLVDDLNSQDKELRKITQSFAEIAGPESVQIPLRCFYETKTTELLRGLLPPSSASWLGTFQKNTQKILVSESSACLDTFERHGLDATHSGMNKFPGPKDANFQQVKEAIKKLADGASSTVKNRQKSSHTRYFIVPFGRNHGFVGRESILHDIVSRVPPDLDNDNCQRTAIEGLGGVGKTQVALEGIYQVHETHDCSIFWVPTINTTSFENAYREIGRQLGIPGLDNDQADVKTLVKLALSNETAGPWLLVIDNADDKELLFGDEGLCEYLPFSRKGSILFTTRNHEVTTHLCIPMTNIFKMAEMNGIEATQLLHNNLRESQTRDLQSPESLLACLAHLPLAIKQASAYMAKTGMSTAKYLDYFQSGDKTRSQLLSRDFEDSNRYRTIRNPITTTWIISFDHILRDAPLAAAYLKFICFLAEKNIPVSLLPRGEDELVAEEAIGMLKAYAFITEREGSSSFDIHRLVRLAMRNWLEEEGEWTQCFTIVIQQLAKVYPIPQHENKEAWTEYLPHAQASIEGRGECRDENALYRLLLMVGNCYNDLGKLQISMDMREQALELSTRVFGPEHPNTLGSMHNFAITLWKRGKYVAAESMHRQTLELRKRILGPEHPDTLASMHGLASTFEDQGKYVAAEWILQRTLDLQRVVLGSERRDTLKTIPSKGGTWPRAPRHTREYAWPCKFTWQSRQA